VTERAAAAVAGRDHLIDINGFEGSHRPAKIPLARTRRVWLTVCRADDTHCRGTINDPLLPLRPSGNASGAAPRRRAAVRRQARRRALPEPAHRKNPRARAGVSGGRRRITGLFRGVWLVAALLAATACAPTIDETARLAGAGTARVAPDPKPVPRFTDREFVTADGQVLPLREWLPAGEVRAVILGLHGFNDYSNAFDGPGKAWRKAGIALYAYDQRGFGAAPQRGRWPGRAALAADAATASAILRRRYPGVPLYLLGESMGGAVAIVAMTGESGTPVPDVDGVILAAPAVWGRSTMDLLSRVALWAGVRLMPGLELTGRGLHIRASDNIPMLRALARDPLVIKDTRVDAIWSLVNLMDAALACAPRLQAPLLLMYGATDEIIPKRAMRRFVRALPLDPRDQRNLAYYEHGYHMLLRDLDGPVVIADVAGWVLAPGAPLLSGADAGGAEAVLGGTKQASLGER
jgi:acylglycerol lipase